MIRSQDGFLVNEGQICFLDIGSHVLIDMVVIPFTRVIHTGLI